MSTSPIRRALIIGINYTGTSNALQGCIQDALNMQELLVSNLQYPRANITMLTDNHTGKLRPTYKNILREIRKFVKGIKAGDHLFFHYSGHGSYVTDTNGDEKDGHDECLIPLDYPKHVILDDQLRNILVNAIPYGVKLFGLIDCCNSGSMFDLRYTLKLHGSRQQVRIRRSSYKSWIDYTKALFKHGFHKSIVNTNTKLEVTENQPNTVGNIVMLSGCKDDQTSADINWGTILGGALTLAFISNLHTLNYRANFETLLKEIQYSVRNSYGSMQTPQLTCGRMEDITSTFVFN